jgi:hypothetical protein
MSHREVPRVSSVILIFLLGLAACNFPGNRTGASLPATPPVEVCATMPDLGLDRQTAASAPALVGSQDAPTLGKLGAQGAQALADQLQPQGTFCDAEAPAAFAPILEKARGLADQGDKEGARKLLNSLLEMGALPRGGGLMSVRPQTPQQARSYIRGYLNAAAIDLLLGGDGQAFIDQANATFNQMANSELGSANLDETLRLAEEAELLGQDDVAQRALKRAQDIAAEGLEAAIEDFDPCLSNPQDLHDEITKLLMAFQTASLMGVPDTHGPGESRYDATWARATEALKALGGETPDECKGFSFQFSRTVSGAVTMTGGGHTCSGLRGPWEGELHLAGTWTDFGNTGEGSGTFVFTLPEGSDQVETTLPISGKINADEGCYMPFSDPLQLRFRLIGEGQVEIGIVSTNAGTASIVCPEGTMGLPSIMTVWTEEPTFTVALERGANCP